MKFGESAPPLIDIADILAGLSTKRPVFHSEADFQHALAWEIHERWPHCSLRLEFKPPHTDKRIHVDIWATNHNASLAVEVKYKTRILTVDLPGEPFKLKDHSAQDTGRYDFLKDLQRLEEITAQHKNTVGYAILLTNDSAYWKVPRDGRTVDASFRIHDGKTVSVTLQWGSAASEGTTQSRAEPIMIKGIYRLVWQVYSEPSRSAYGLFRYLLVKVDLPAGFKP